MSTPEDQITQGMRAAVDQAEFVEEDEATKAAREKERAAVEKLWKEYEQAREFDKAARAQYAIDRRYAAGTADNRWAVNTNLIGSFIDILTSFLYARNPDVSAKKAPRVNSRGTRQDDDFAKTMELVISTLWKQSRLKRPARKCVRSSLSVGVGWLKVVMVADAPNLSQMKTEQNDARDNIARLEALRNEMIENGQYESIEEQEAKIAEAQELLNSINQRMEATIRKYLAVDYVRAEDMQVSLDVPEIGDYLDAGWTANAIYRPVTELKKMFPRLRDEDIKNCTQYFQKQQKDLTPITDQTALDGSTAMADEAEQYVTGKSSGTSEDTPAFAKIVELWDRRTGHVKTMIDGCKYWAKEPYQPDYPSSRFYPYFLVAFYEVDGARHPQSLSWRLHKLQEEYARSRSNFRLTRERAIPGTLFNATGMEPDEIRKIERGVHQEFIGVKPTNPETPLQNLFAPKPVEKVDPRMYDNTPIITDMEKVAGVQEALQTSMTQAKTATEAEFQQQGFASRTTSDRDTLETMLTDLANYTGELALSALSVKDVQRIAGAHAFWPTGMDLDDLLTMVEIEITAGTTGKPKNAGDREAWGVVLPVIKETIAQVQQAYAMGNLPLAEALIEVLRETMIRMGDDTDIDRFIPQPPAPAPVVPGAPGADPGAGADPGLPPDPASAGAGAPAAPELATPELIPPELTSPV